MYERPEGIEDCRIWIDGCFDFAHHGHAGAMLQARQLGKELYVGVHSDEEILANKGPTVMRLDERITAVEACKWTTKAIPDAPYVTDPEFMDKYGCPYVVHGDDITTDANGEDCYQVVKDLGRFVVVKRTPNISTTDLVGRMLLMSKNHHYPTITRSTDKLLSEDNLDRFKRYATDNTGLKPGSAVYLTRDTLEEVVAPGAAPENVVYIDGGFDLFHPGHIEVLKIAHEEASRLNAKVIVGLHDDAVVNEYKGLNYPIMNLLERSLCVLQCRYVDGIILGAPYKPTPEFLKKLGSTNVVKVYHGPTEIDEGVYDEVDPAIFDKIGKHKYDHMNTEYIVNRVLANKQAYEERQKRKGWKAEVEKKLEADEKKR
ncbi:Ethanolamine-phosphate cytidylyltransferase [Candida viswanathii]|uniref:ethanolamine-phosphate cytidylyltransferase n=1 Tax=Candida viswanathii TaxID=5486 RepID=A0A367XM69_9ASCO|nr:Ethanolamine-phosphate cytidylyltransferase [Candida viswanathii]